MYFDERRQKLLKEICSLEEDTIKSNFKSEFFKLVEDVILYLLQNDDNFFGQFMLKVKRDIRLDISYPLATIPKRGEYNMYFNPILFLQCTKKEMGALIKHEIYHIMYSHYERKKDMESRFNKEAIVTALDISINQYISDLPAYSLKLDSINKEYNLNLKENRSVEEYAEEIYKSIKSRVKEITKDEGEFKHDILMQDSHDIWNEIEVSSEDIDVLTKKTAICSYDENAPEELSGILERYNEKPQISWQQVLRNLIPSVKCGYKKTITRRNRRQPERLELRGRLPKKEAEIIIALDISASIKDDDLYKILIEVMSIASNVKNNITVIECDNEIRKVYKLRSKQDIQKRTKNNGATEFTPVFKYIKENNLRDSILIYFTDGVGEKELGIVPINKKIIWVLCGDDDLSLDKAYGEIKRIDSKKHEKLEGNIGLQMVNSVIHDWAR